MQQRVEDFFADETLINTLTVVYFPTDLALPVEKKQRRLASLVDNYYYISQDSQLLPFLTIKENFLVGVNRKKVDLYAERFQRWQSLFKLKESINQSYPAEISLETQLIIHLIRGFVLEKKTIFLDDLDLNLSTEFLLSLLPILKKIAKEHEIKIILLTRKEFLTQDCHLKTITAESVS